MRSLPVDGHADDVPWAPRQRPALWDRLLVALTGQDAGEDDPGDIWEIES
jgi:hypothetical protein